MRTNHVVFKFFVTPFSIVCAANATLQLMKNKVEYAELLLDVNSGHGSDEPDDDGFILVSGRRQY